MSVKLETLEHSMVKMTFEVPFDQFDKAVNKVYNKQKGKINLAGFRKGKAPRVMIEKMYGEGIFWDDAINEILPETYPAALKEAGVEAASRPQIDVEKIEKGQPLVITAEFAVKPEIELGTYKGVTVTKVDTAVTDEQIQAELETQQKNQAREVSVERAIVEGDIAVIDFEGFMDGEAFEGGKGENHRLEIGSHSFIPGFEEALVGAKTGDDVDVNVTFPEDYQAAELAGKPAVFKCKIHDVIAKEMPEIDDEFASECSKYDTLAEYKESIKQNLEEKAKADAKQAQTDEAVDKIIEASKMDIPEAMIEYQSENIISDFANRIQSQGLSFDQYLKFSGTDLDGLKEQVRPDALKRIQSALVLEAIAKAENIEVTDADVDEDLAAQAKAYGIDAEELKKYFGEEGLEDMKKDLRIRKAADFVFENVKESKAKKTTTKKKAEAKEEATEEA